MWYTRARLAENERTRCLLIEAYIGVRLSHFRDEAYTHYTNHGPHFGESPRLIEGDWENSLKQYHPDKAALLLEKRHEEECKEKVAQRDATIFAALNRCSLLPNPTPKNLTVDVLKGAIKAIKASSTFQYAGLRLGGNRASLLDQIEAVLEPYEAQGCRLRAQRLDRWSNAAAGAPAGFFVYRFVLVCSQFFKKINLTNYQSVCPGASMGTCTHQRLGRKAHIGGIIPPTYLKLTKRTLAYTVTCFHPPKITIWCHRGRFTKCFCLKAIFV